jgi:predicted metallo-beta-lactamase superfamily hydrolase
LNIIPLAFESLGVVSLAPRRYGLPHTRLYDEAKSSDIIIITHYHYDHHDPGYIIPLDIKGCKL